MNKIKNKDIQKHLNYLFTLATLFPDRKQFLRRFIRLTKHNQLKLGKIKRMICFECTIVLVVGNNCHVDYEKRENGFGQIIKCLKCSNEKFIVYRGRKTSH